MDDTLGIFLAATPFPSEATGRRSGASPDTLDEDARPDPKIAVITALPKEMAALKDVLGVGIPTPTEIEGAILFSTTTVAVGRGAARKEEEVVLCQCVKMGNNSAAVAATALLIKYPSIEDILMVGIAGGMPVVDWGKGKCSKHVRKGDVVVGTEVVQYDLLKVEVDNHENRMRPVAPSARLVSVQSLIEEEKFRGNDEFSKRMRKEIPEQYARPRADVLYRYFRDQEGKLQKKKIRHPSQDRPRGAPLIHNRGIGSANTLLKDHNYRDELASKFGFAAVEMEGSGVADSAWHFGRGYLVVRGVCDYCDMDKDDDWQSYAAYAAAAYAKLVIEKAIALGP